MVPQVEGDPFSLKRNADFYPEHVKSCQQCEQYLRQCGKLQDPVSKWPGWMREKYFHGGVFFLFNVFKEDLLVAIERAVDAIFESRSRSFPSLKRVTTNKDFYPDHIESCPHCTHNRGQNDRLLD